MLQLTGTTSEKVHWAKITPISPYYLWISYTATAQSPTASLSPSLHHRQCPENVKTSDQEKIWHGCSARTDWSTKMRKLSGTMSPWKFAKQESVVSPYSLASLKCQWMLLQRVTKNTSPPTASIVPTSLREKRGKTQLATSRLSTKSEKRLQRMVKHDSKQFGVDCDFIDIGTTINQ